jgi:hypothetical protein
MIPGVFMMTSMRLALAGAAVALCLSATPGLACNRGVEVCTFTLFNNTSIKLESFWASPARVSKWENDILGSKVLNAGSEISVNMSDNRPDCIYDFRFKFADGDIITRSAVNVCKLDRYTLDE